MKSLITLSFLALLTGCAATYSPPIQQDIAVSSAISGSKSDLMSRVKRAIISEGYQITNADDVAGIVSAAPKPMHLSPELANCGRTLGLDYLLDNRTSPTVGIGAVVDNGVVSIKANISATYLPSDVSQGITLTCVSTGYIEHHLLALISSSK